MSNKWIMLLPYWFLLFTIGFGWFLLAPLIPALIGSFHVSIGSILLLISAYGYTMVILGLLAGYISAKFTVKTAIYASALISVVGLFGRAISPNYTVFLVTGIIAAIAYPMAMAPVGSIAKSLFPVKSNTVIGISVGILFLGLASGSFLGPYAFSSFGLSGALWLTAILSVIAAVFVFTGTKGYPVYYKGKSLKGVFKTGMVKNWYVGLAISSMSVMFGSIGSTVLLLHKISLNYALAYGGIFGGLVFLGSAIGAIIIPPVFERYKILHRGFIITGTLMFISIAIVAISLSYSVLIIVIATGYFLFGIFGNAYWSMAMTSTTNYVNDPAQAGFATSMYSVFTNLGVAFIPVFLGVDFASLSTITTGVIIVLVIELIAMALSPLLKIERESETGNGAHYEASSK